MPAVQTMPSWSRRRFLGLIVLLCLGRTQPAVAMGQSGAFSARRLTTARLKGDPERDTALSRWGWELVRRTSAPARLSATVVAADAPELLDEPFVVWSGATDLPPLLPAERRGLEAFIRLGGVIVVDDSRPETGEFTRAAKRELRKVLPSVAISSIDSSHVIFRTFYLLSRAQGRIAGPERVEAMVRGSMVHVLFLSCDLLGALASKPEGPFLFATEPNTSESRERALRFAVNLAMYMLCSDYKDDQVHAPWLMRRRAKLSP